MTDGPFSLLAIFEAILAWQKDPGADTRGAVGSALGAMMSATGGRGAFLAADASALPRLQVGWGTLDSFEPPGRAAHAFELSAGEGRVRTGWLWLDPDWGAPDVVVRALGLALEAAWSRAEVRQTADRLEALDAATRGIAGLHPLDRVLQLIADRVRELINAQYSALGIVDEYGVIERFVTSGMSREQREAIGPLPRGHGLLGLIIRENRSYRIPDIRAHANSSGFPPAHPPMASFLGVPIQVKGRSVGNFYLTNKANAAEFSDSDQRLVEMFALHAGVAIENARLHEQVQRLAVVDERVRIGKDLHDGIIQSIYAVGLSLEDVPELMHSAPEEASQRVDRAIDSLNLTIRDIRNFIFGLRPELAEEAGLVVGLAALTNEFRLNTVIDVELEAAEDLPPVGDHRRGELLKIVREALSNTARHSRASRVSVCIGMADDLLEVVIADNGTGFPVGGDRGREHQGLANMRARAFDLGGELLVKSTSGSGTTITIRLPATSAVAHGDESERGTM